MKYDLLSVESDAKTSKGTDYGYLTGILYLAPATEANGITNLCTYASPECREACLYGAGMAGVFPSIKNARIKKTLEYLSDPAGFRARLVADIVRLKLEAKGRKLKPSVRINGTSDIPKLARSLAREFPNVQFYDYTKIPRAWVRTMPNYHLTFSHSGINLSECLATLKHGVSVAVVFAGGLPAMWHGYPVINGDKSDLLFIDSPGVVVGLSPKGRTAGNMVPSAMGFIQIGGSL